jgi:hypothetical protein
MGMAWTHSGLAPRRLSRRMILTGGFATLAASALPAISIANQVGEADSSDQARDQTIGSLPLDELTAETRRKLMAVCERPTLFRRLPQQTFSCDPTLHIFLIRNPEVVVNIWQLMEVAHMTADRQGPYLWKGTDGAGTACDVELVYGTNDLHIFYTDGFYEGSLLKRKVMGRCVMCLRSGYAYGQDRRPFVANRLDLFLQIDNLAADAVARTLSPWVGKVADANFRESCVFASKLSQTAEQNPAGVQRLSDKLDKVEAPVREQFAKITSTVPERIAALSASSAVQRR